MYTHKQRIFRHMWLQHVLNAHTERIHLTFVLSIGSPLMNRPIYHCQLPQKSKLKNDIIKLKILAV